MSSSSELTLAKAQDEQSNKLKDLPSIRFAEACGFFGDPTFTIYVSSSSSPQEPKEYLLPKTHLCDESAFFRVAFSGHFVESAKQVLHLAEEGPWVFELVI